MYTGFTMMFLFLLYGGPFAASGHQQLSLVHVAPVGNSRDADEFCCIIDDVHHSPVTDPYTPLISVAFQLFAACGPRRTAQSLELLDDPGQHVIR
jgi:hypothetical protein